MKDWQWESFEKYINEEHFNIRESDCLAFPTESIFIKRNRMLDLVIETKCREGVKSISASYPPGTIRQSLDNAILESSSGCLVNLSGIVIKEMKINLVIKEDNTNELLHEYASVHKIFCQMKKENEGKYLIEWLGNVDDMHYKLPDLIDEEIESTQRMILGKNRNILILEASKKEFGGRWGCINFSVDGYELYLGVCKNSSLEKEKMPGFILYKGVPSKEVREKIRICASFVFGRPFIYLGHTIFDYNWQAVSFEAISPYNDMEGRAFDLITSPPAPLWDTHKNWINREKFSYMVNAIYKKYDECDFRHVSWLYWHAISAPLHMAGADFGATIEAIYKPFNLSQTLMPEDIWNSLKDHLLKAIAEKNIAKEDLSILVNRIKSNLNQAPKDIVAKKFLATLNISLSDLEGKAWLQRNKGAHGGVPNNENYIDAFKKTKILQVLCNRMVLSITDASNNYIDYHTVNFPIKHLQEPIE